MKDKSNVVSRRNHSSSASKVTPSQSLPPLSLEKSTTAMTNRNTGSGTKLPLGEDPLPPSSTSSTSNSSVCVDDYVKDSNIIVTSIHAIDTNCDDKVITSSLLKKPPKLSRHSSTNRNTMVDFAVASSTLPSWIPVVPSEQESLWGHAQVNPVRDVTMSTTGGDSSTTRLQSFHSNIRKCPSPQTGQPRTDVMDLNDSNTVDQMVATMSQDKKDAILRLFFGNDKFSSSSHAGLNDIVTPHATPHDGKPLNTISGIDADAPTAKFCNHRTSSVPEYYNQQSDNVSLMSMTISPSLSSSFCTTESRGNNMPNNRGMVNHDRPVVHDGAYFTAVYLICIAIVLGLGAYSTIEKSIEDQYFIRCIIFLFYPLIFGMTMFPFRIAIYNVLALFGSWRNVYQNSRYHSALLPPRIPSHKKLPAVCIQMPVYKESFTDTIQPSLDNIRKAIEHYQQCGGQAFMFINDDGLQLISDDDRKQRIDYYNTHQIAYIARPAHNILPRYGLFKKASNMNFCLNFALEVAEQQYETTSTTIPAPLKSVNSEGMDTDPESNIDIEILEGIERVDSPSSALETVTKRRAYPILAGGPIEQMEYIRYILLVDSDTRVPPTCLYDTVGEFVQEPKVAFIQHATTVLRVDDNYWESVLAHFTHLLYSVFIPMGTALGEPSPLVGHNATLNWNAIQEVSWYDENVGYRKFWSESHVSEDFDLSIRLQSAGYIGRYALYTGDKFQEGVSVTVHDEIKKLKKFSFGAGEMLFNPFKDWLCKGPISPLIRKYLATSSIPWHARINLVAYLFTYVAMSYGVVAIPLAFYIGFLDGFGLNMPSAWQLMIGTFLIFGVIGTANGVALTLFLGHHQSFTTALMYEVSHLLPLSIFYTGVQYHICTSFLRYMFSMKAEWGATVKELDSSSCKYNFMTFLTEVTKTMCAYWDLFLWLFAMTAFLIYFFRFLGPDIDVQWSGWAASPLCLFLAGHAFMPILFNPIAMRSLYYPIRTFFVVICCCCCLTKPLDDDHHRDDAIPTHIVSVVNNEGDEEISSNEFDEQNSGATHRSRYKDQHIDNNLRSPSSKS